VNEPVLPERQVSSRVSGEVGEWQRPKRLGPVVKIDTLAGAAVGPHPPGHHHVELKGPAGVHQALVVVGAHHPGHHRLEVLALQGSAEPLDTATVRTARRADVSIAPVLLADPLLGVEPIIDLLVKGVVLAL